MNRHGRRFVSENDFNVGEALDRRDPVTGAPVHLPVWLIGDSRFLARTPAFRWYARKDPAWITRGGSLEELAGRTALPDAELRATVARFNAFCDAGKDEDFGRGETAWENYKSHGPEGKFGRIEQPPFVAIPLNRSILGTKGGARTNERGQVLRPDASIIAGLYAAGLAMANPIGTRALGAGTTLGPNLTWGFICAETILRQNRSGE